MSRAGPVSRAALVCQEPGWPSCHVIAKLIFIAFLTNVPRSRQTDTSPAHVIRP